MLDRLHKILARAGVAALRPAEDMILQGRVTVNGRIVRELGARADPQHDVIAVDGTVVEVPEPTDPHRYLLLHKPVGVISTARDTHDRPTVLQLVPNDVRVFPVGRLDGDSEGLMLLTDDGDLAYRLMHPRFEVEKEYRVLVDRTPELSELRRWRSGVSLDGELTAGAWVEVLERGTGGTWLRVVMREGRKRQIREVARILGLNVLRLIRVREGPLALGELPAGKWRELTQTEVEALRAHTQHVPSREADEERERRMADEETSRPRRLRVIRRKQHEDLPEPAAARGDDTAPGRGPEAEADTQHTARQRQDAMDAREDRAGGQRTDDRQPPPAERRERGRFDQGWTPREGQPRFDDRRGGSSSERSGPNRGGPVREDNRGNIRDVSGPRTGSSFGRDERRSGGRGFGSRGGPNTRDDRPSTGGRPPSRGFGRAPAPRDNEGNRGRSERDTGFRSDPRDRPAGRGFGQRDRQRPPDERRRSEDRPPRGDGNRRFEGGPSSRSRFEGSRPGPRDRSEGQARSNDRPLRGGQGFGRGSEDNRRGARGAPYGDRSQRGAGRDDASEPNGNVRGERSQGQREQRSYGQSQRGGKPERRGDIRGGLGRSRPADNRSGPSERRGDIRGGLGRPRPADNRSGGTQRRSESSGGFGRQRPQSGTRPARGPVRGERSRPPREPRSPRAEDEE